MRALFTGLLWLLVLFPVLAQEEDTVRLLIRTEPSRANIKLNDSPLGESGTAIFLSRNRLPEKASALHLTVERDNYLTTTLDIPIGQFLNDQVIYPTEPLPLTPKHSLVPVLENPLPFGLLALAILGAGILWRKTRHERNTALAREAALATIESQIEKHDKRIKVLGGYRILDKIGQGGMAQVYRAIPDETLDESNPVAIKLLHSSLYEEADNRARFVREGQVSKDLVHPNVVRLFELNSQGDDIYLVLEYIAGETLRTRMKRERVEIREAKDILGQVLEGLSYAHELNVIHRDLTPGNIMISEEGRVKLMDFGLARRREVDKTITVTGMVQGTPGYMAPEQITEKLDARSDQYALGVVAFELLTGRRPHEGSEAMQLIWATISADPPHPREVNPDLSEPVAEFVHRLLQRAPEDRYATMAEARDAFLEAFRKL